jgi:outer membrane receptor protein involved in Fe transport
MFLGSRRWAWAASVALVTAGLGLAAPAARSQNQSESPDSLALAEVVVTARKREESLQDVPLSITAFTAETLEQRGIESVFDVARITPNLSFNRTFGRSFDRPVIRGMSQILGARTVSFVVDGIYIAGSLSGTDLDDVETLEVLKGPQAANYGRGSLAGVIAYRTKRPTSEWTGRAAVTAGDYGYREVSGNISGPISGDTLTFKLGGRYYDYDGQYTAVSSDGRTPTVGGENTKRVSGAIRWAPTEDFDVTFRAFAAQNDDYLFNNIIFTQLNCFQTAGGAAARGGSYCGVIPDIPRKGRIQVDLADIERQGDPGITQDIFLYSAEANWNLGPVTATALVSWNRQDEDWIIDDYVINRNTFGNQGPSQVPGPTLTVANPGNVTRLINIFEYQSQELRFASNSDGPFQWLFGLYNYEQDDSGFNGGPRYHTVASMTGTVGVLREISQRTSPFSIKNQAVFGSVNWDPTERLHLSLEGRYARDKLQTNNAVQAGGNCARLLEAEYKSFTPRGSVRFEFTEEVNIYFSVAQGNKPGAFNNALCGTTIPAAEFARLAALTPLGIKEEESLNFEIGTKMRLLNGRMSIDAALFFTDWEKQQVTTSQLYTQVNGQPGNLTLTGNAGKTEVSGMELSWALRVNEHWDLNLAYGHTRARFKEFCDNTYAVLLGPVASPVTTTGPCPTIGTTRYQSVAGFQTANAPEHTGSFGVEFNTPLTESWKLFARGDVSYQSERFAEVYNHASTGDSTVVNARLGISADQWRITLWGRNIGDDRSPNALTRFFDTDSPTLQRGYQVNYADGRQLGLTAEYKF